MAPVSSQYGQFSTSCRKSWETGNADLEVVLAELVKFERFSGTALEAFEPLRTKGLNHAHVRIRGSGALLRIPRLSTFGLDPVRNLAYQQACFLRAEPSLVTPELFAVIGPREGLPWGALVVREIAGHVPELPRHLTDIARSLAAIHRLDVPDAAQCKPLQAHTNPLAATCEVVVAQAAYLELAGVCKESMAILADELRWVQGLPQARDLEDHAVTLVGSDTHPGNFLVAERGGAVFVDLEKMVYGSPAIDLAHASIYTSTMWDDDISVVLTPQQTEVFMKEYFSAIPNALADRIRDWWRPMRRLTWLRTTTWCARWCVEAEQDMEWSPLHRNPEYMDTVRKRFEDYLDPGTLARVREGLQAESRF